MDRKRKDSSEIAPNVDVDLAVHRRQDDVLDQRAQHVGSLDPPFFGIVLQGLIKLLEAHPVLARHCRMQQGGGSSA
ncbi:hypothetical protein RN629_17690 [Sphingomonadaceae bacterium jetA1]|uniref:hypothetical protein n=1 Tax=Facivitalis istanbulensis TaxID=3075838 RepID=UPI003469D8F3